MYTNTQSPRGQVNSFDIFKEKSKSQKPGVAPGHTQKEALQTHRVPRGADSFQALLYSLELDFHGEIPLLSNVILGHCGSG